VPLNFLLSCRRMSNKGAWYATLDTKANSSTLALGLADGTVALFCRIGDPASTGCLESKLRGRWVGG
jgi:hypothetical protein